MEIIGFVFNVSKNWWQLAAHGDLGTVMMSWALGDLSGKRKFRSVYGESERKRGVFGEPTSKLCVKIDGAILIAPMCKISDNVRIKWPITQVPILIAKIFPNFSHTHV